MGFDSGGIGIYGGVFENNPYITQKYKELINKNHSGLRIFFPEFEPELGAIIYYFAENGILDEDILSRIKSTKNKKEREFI